MEYSGAKAEILHAEGTCTHPQWQINIASREKQCLAPSHSVVL